MKQYDIIIIGAGPAGLMAARTLEKTKIDYLLIDGKKRLGYPLKCGEGVYAEAFEGFFGKKKYSFIRNRVKFHKIFYKDVERIFAADYYQLDRPRWEQWMGKGLNVLLDCRMEDIIIKRDVAEVHTAKGIFLAKLVILSCGCNFNMQKKFGLFKKNPIISIAYGGIFKDHGLPKDTFYYYFDDYYGYMWIFPKSSTLANIGVGYFKTKKKINPKKLLFKLLKKYGIKANQISEYGGIAPCSGPIEKTFFDRMLICGDSAGLLYAGTGEGIKFALKSGKIAAEVAIKAVEKNQFDEKFLKMYEKSWKKSFGKDMEAGKIFFDIMIAAAKMGRVKELFKTPTDKELRQFIIEGKTPLRAKIAWKIVKKAGMDRL